jgi:hypothetical protein
LNKRLGWTKGRRDGKEEKKESKEQDYGSGNIQHQ